MTQEKKIDIELNDEVAQGKYANLAIISHSASEFVVDFAALMPGVPKARVHSRIILTPEHAKRLLMSLQDNITRYESNVGRIEVAPSAWADPADEQEPIVGFNIGEA
ncbi:DUF3467 domain-containing protein [Alistipes sp. OttesenSCG-928-B03]|nr:DUF3467 domain-containing protein [Alistipes sp. OttesenSCG-928-B03]